MSEHPVTGKCKATSGKLSCPDISLQQERQGGKDENGDRYSIYKSIYDTLYKRERIGKMHSSERNPGYGIL
jgi:hypothetical protein